LNWCSYQD